jgi:hypothetical protein
VCTEFMNGTTGRRGDVRDLKKANNLYFNNLRRHFPKVRQRMKDMERLSCRPKDRETSYGTNAFVYIYIITQQRINTCRLNFALHTLGNI